MCKQDPQTELKEVSENKTDISLHLPEELTFQVSWVETQIKILDNQESIQD